MIAPDTFEIVPAFHHPIPARYERFPADNGIEIAGAQAVAGFLGEEFAKQPYRGAIRIDALAAAQ